MFLVYTTLATQGAGIGSESILDVDELGYLHKVWLFGVKMTNISDPLETHLNWIGSYKFGTGQLQPWVISVTEP